MLYEVNLQINNYNMVTKCSKMDTYIEVPSSVCATTRVSTYTHV